MVHSSLLINSYIKNEEDVLRKDKVKKMKE